MDGKSYKARLLIGFGIAAGAVIFMAPYTFLAYRDWSFICENTGSHMGYREWFFGLQTRQWYRTSEVEAFMKAHFPNDLEHSWTSYAGTGRNIFGGKLLHGHARPGPIFHLREKDLNRWFATLSDQDKRAFYDLLVKDDAETIKGKVDAIYEDLFASPRNPL